MLMPPGQESHTGQSDLNPKIEIYGFPEDVIICPNCRNAERLCKLHGVNYTFHPIIDEIVQGRAVRNIENTHTLMRRMGKSSSDTIKVPQIFVNNEHIGGLQDLKNYFK